MDMSLKNTIWNIWSVVLIIFASNLVVAQTSVSSDYVPLLNKHQGEWVAANYSQQQLNQPGMVCVRFNNYWCIKSPMGKPTYWDGQESQDSRGHAQFSHPKYAARAFVKLMRTYYFTHNLRSANDIMNRYAPATDTIGSVAGGRPNPTTEYAKQISRALGKSPDEDLKLFANETTVNKNEMVALLITFAKWEITANNQVTKELALDGIALAGY